MRQKQKGDKMNLIEDPRFARAFYNRAIVMIERGEDSTVFSYQCEGNKTPTHFILQRGDRQLASLYQMTVEGSDFHMGVRIDAPSVPHKKEEAVMEEPRGTKNIVRTFSRAKEITKFLLRRRQEALE